MVRPYVPNIGDSELAQRLGRKVTETEEALLENTNAYKYGGYKDRGARERSKLRQADTTSEAIPQAEQVEANPEAGQSVIMHKNSRLAQLWDGFKENSAVLKKFHGLKQRYEESNNLFVFFLREATGSVTGRLGHLFAETETAKALREIAIRDPTFHMETFMKDAHEYLIPEILDALLCGDMSTLRTWCSEASFNMLKATFDAQLKVGHRMEGRILDLRHIEVQHMIDCMTNWDALLDCDGKDAGGDASYCPDVQHAADLLCAGQQRGHRGWAGGPGGECALRHGTGQGGECPTQQPHQGLEAPRDCHSPRRWMVKRDSFEWLYRIIY